MDDTGNIKMNFVELCVEHGLFEREAAASVLDKDLFESNIIDSMGILTMQSLIMETYGIEIPEPLFVAELRTINRVMAYVGKTIRNRENHHGTA